MVVGLWEDPQEYMLMGRLELAQATNNHGHKSLETLTTMDIQEET